MIEVALQICIHDIDISFVEQTFNARKCIVTTNTVTKAKAAVMERLVENRL